MASSVDYKIYAGDAEALSMTMLQYDAITALDLSTCTDLVCEAKRVLSDPDSVARISKSVQIQTITVTGSPAGGTIATTIGGQTATVPFDATAAALKTLLEALSSVGSGKAIVHGGPGPATPWTVILCGSAAGQTISVVASLTGGSAPAAAVTTAGSGITIVSPSLGQITVQLVPADTAGVQATLQLQYAAKAFFSATSESTGAIGLLTITPTVVNRT